MSDITDTCIHYVDAIFGPDSRWHRAVAAYKDTCLAKRQRDRYVRAAIRYLNGDKKRHHKTPPSCCYETVKTAVMLHKNKEHKQYVEALCLCSDLSRADTAKMVSVSEDVLEVYEALFWNIRHLHGSVMALMFHVIPPVELDKPEGPASEIRWYWLAIQGGYRLLKAYLDPHNADPAQYDELQEIARKRLIVEAAMSAYTQQLNYKQFRKILKMLDVATGAGKEQSEEPESAADPMSNMRDAVHEETTQPSGQPQSRVA